jgi:RNA polymerase sigma-70 factor (sigma-E family)
MVAESDFEAFVQASSARVLHLAELLCGDRHRAEDLTQTAYSRLYPRWDRLDDPYAFTRRVLVNLRNDWWRRGRRELPGVVPETSVPDWASESDRRLIVLSALAHLTARERAVVVLRYYEDLSEVAIGDALGIAPGTVKSTAARALGKLRTSGHLDDLAPYPLGDRHA